VLERGERSPYTADVALPDSRSVRVTVDREALAEGIRVSLYWMPEAREVPRLLALADRGDVAPLAQAILQANIGLRSQLAIGMLLSVVCGEDVPRIAAERIPTETQGTFLGATRITNQRAVCADWPRRPIPADFETPIPGRVPVLLLSGSHDPVTGPEWGEATLPILANARHLVVPGAQNIGGPCMDAIRQAFLEQPDPVRLDAGCLASMTLPPFTVSPRR
jgi:pimeloyl-ACP methyl ester carboxylesterase